MSLRRNFPDSARFYREDGGELFMSWIGDLGEYHEPVQTWVDENTIGGTTFDVIETTGGKIVSVVLSLPGGGVSGGPVAARRFRLIRHEDVSGVSGIGVVAHGVEWSDGTVSLRWGVPGLDPSFANWDSIEAVERVHGHHGKTEVEWID